jgi:hypothetical protein
MIKDAWPLLGRITGRRFRPEQEPMRVVLIFLSLLAVSGCTTLHVPASMSQCCGYGVAACPDRCVILVEAIPDLGRWGRLPQIAELLRENGVETIYFDPTKDGLSAESLASVIRYQRCKLGKQVMLVGWSYGTIQSLDALHLLSQEGVGIETFINVECLNLNMHRGFDVQPTNVNRTVLVYRNLSWLPRGFCNPVVKRLDSIRHLQAMGDVDCVETLYNEARMMPSVGTTW